MITVSQGAEAQWGVLTMVSSFQSISIKLSKKASNTICVPTARVATEGMVILIISLISCGVARGQYDRIFAT